MNNFNKYVYVAWLNDIKANGCDSKGRVSNPLKEGSRTFTNKRGAYKKLYNWCVVNLPGYDFAGIPVPPAPSATSKSASKLPKHSVDADVYIAWLDDIKKNGVDAKGRVRNPLQEGGYLYVAKNGLYSTLWNWCVHTLQGSYDFTGIPRPVKVVYKHNSRYGSIPCPSASSSRSSKV
jgi:hypothetical protein